MAEGQHYMSDWFREAEAKGIAEGERRGRAEEARRALRTILSARGLGLDAASEQRIAACQDLDRLEAWIARAVTAATLAEVFASA